MDASDWIALAALVVAVVSGGGAVMYARRSAVEAKRSADAAERMREIDAGRREDEKERRHEEFAPDLPAEITSDFYAQGPNYAGGVLVGTIRVTRPYRIRAFSRAGEALTELAVPRLAPVNEPITFAIQPWTPDQGAPHIREVLFRFWPPVGDTDPGQMWACTCGRPTGETMDGSGHWEHRVRVRHEDDDRNDLEF